MHSGKASAAKAHCLHYAPICLQYSRKGKTHSSVFEDLTAMNWSSVLQNRVAPSEAEEEGKQSINTGGLQGPEALSSVICVFLDHHHGLSILPCFHWIALQKLTNIKQCEVHHCGQKIRITVFTASHLQCH